jgi:hypothetical protein
VTVAVARRGAVADLLAALVTVRVEFGLLFGG